MHLKPDPVGLEFLKQFGLMFVLVIFYALTVIDWLPSRRSKREKDNP